MFMALYQFFCVLPLLLVLLAIISEYKVIVQMRGGVVMLLSLALEIGSDQQTKILRKKLTTFMFMIMEVYRPEQMGCDK